MRPGAPSDRRRRARRSPAVLILTLLAVAWGCAPASEDRAPDLRGAASGWNLLLLTVDTVRADRLGAYGYTARETSPQIDALLATGVRFERATAPRALTWPSLASVLTGLYPSSHGVIQNGYDLPDDLLSLPKILQAAGYQTGAFLSNMCQANHQGWDRFFCGKGVDSRVSARALEWAEQLAGDRPFFAWVHYFAAHSPYYNGASHIAGLSDPSYDGPVGPKKGLLDRIMKEGVALGAEDIDHLDAIYDAAVLGTDRHVGGLLAGLRERARLERTVVVFLADHGEDLYDHHGYIYHACSVYETGLHVPLGFSAPGILAAGAVAPQPVELIDVAPTLLELLGIASLPDAHGKSLLPYLTAPGDHALARPTFSQYDDTRIHTVLSGRWKLVENPEAFRPRCFPEAPEDLYPIAEVELYDLATDPEERTNLASAHPEVVTELEGLIERRFAGLPDRIRHQELPPELQEELRALGYIAN